MNGDVLALDSELAQRFRTVLGRAADPMEEVEARAAAELGKDAIVWEGDAATFLFSYVGDAAERVLGYPAARWREDGFWAGSVVHPDDRDDAVAFCAVATGQGRDHDFQYRATTVDGRTVWLHDFVVVIRGDSGIPERLRGVMVPVPAPAG